MPDCVHRVDFDKMEMIRDRKGKLRMRTGCQRCGTEVTLGEVLESLAKRTAGMNARLLELEGEGESDDESVPGSD